MFRFLKKLLSSKPKQEKVKPVVVSDTMKTPESVLVPTPTPAPVIAEPVVPVDQPKAVEPVPQVIEPKKLEVKKFTEKFTSTDPYEQVTQVIKFYNSYSAIDGEYYRKQNYVFTPETVDLLLKQIYTTQEAYIKHINRLPFTNELQWAVYLDSQDKMEVHAVDRIARPLNKDLIVDRAVKLEVPLNINQDKPAKNI